MIKNIKIENFRGIQFIEFNPKSLNIIVGPNNTGKTSILEAISLIFYGINNFETNMNCFISNRNKILHMPKYLIFNDSDFARISLEIESSIKNKYELNLFIKKFKPEALSNNYFNTYNKYLTSLIDLVKDISLHNSFSYQNQRYEAIKNELLFSLEIPNEIKFEAILQKNTKKLFSKYIPIKDIDDFFKFFGESPLKYLEKKINFDLNFYYNNTLNLSSIRPYYRKLVKDAKFSEAFDKIKERLYYFDDLREIKGELFVTLKKKNGEKYAIPFNIMGDGFKALISLNLLFAQKKNSVFLLEEPETGLHPGYIEILSEELIYKCKNNQMFITTHSEDLIRNILNKSEEFNFLDEILLLRLSKNQNIVDREILTKDEILTELREIRIDLRGY